MTDETSKAYQYWLHTLPKVGDATIASLLEYFGEPENIYKEVLNKNPKITENLKRASIDETYNATVKWDVAREYEKLKEKGISFVTLDEEEYPERLLEIASPPYAVYYKGRLPEDDVPSVAIIGARECSEYGTYVANAFGEALAGQNINIISGMARGVDGISQRGALNVDGATFGVLGSGVDVCYPMGNFKLYRDIQKKGGILSTFPPGTDPNKQNFPERNRIVAALADLVLVVEARQKSGTSITVDLALKMGKDVYAIPGRLTDRLSDGCNTLIRNGAGVALSPEDVLRELSLIWQTKHPGSSRLDARNIPKLDVGRPGEDIGVLAYVDTNPMTGEQIHARRLEKEKNVSLKQTLSELVMLCADGSVTQVGTGYFYRNMC